MDIRAKIPVLPPVLNPTISYWQDPPDPELADYRSNDTLPAEVDTLIVGSGITGASVAYELLKERETASVLLLEARQVCSGATGRNGGHTKAASYRSFIEYAESFSRAIAAQVARFEYDNIKSLHAFAKENNIDCGLYEGDTVDVIYEQGQWEEAVAGVQAMRDTMPDELDGVAKYTFWSAEEAREKFKVGGDECLGAVSYAAGSLSAYDFVLGVLKLCLARGLQLFSHTPVEKLERRGESWVASTNRGEVRAKRVILATNGYTAAIWPKFQGAIVPLRGQVAAHRLGSEVTLGKGGLETTYSFIYKDGYEYMIPRIGTKGKDNAVVIGGGLAISPNDGEAEYGIVDDGAKNEDISAYLRQSVKMYFGDEWGEERGSRDWSGIMGFTPDGMPFVGEVEPDLWVCAAFQGHGMVLCWGCAKALSKMIRGEAVGELFPTIFEVSEERLKEVFKGRLS